MVRKVLSEHTAGTAQGTEPPSSWKEELLWGAKNELHSSNLR